MKIPIDQFDFDFYHTKRNYYNVEFNETLYLHRRPDYSNSIGKPSFRLSNETNSHPVDSLGPVFIRKYIESETKGNFLILNPRTSALRFDSEPMDIIVEKRHVSSLDLIC